MAKFNLSFFVVSTLTVAFGVLLFADTSLGFGKKSDICGSWNNYCRGAPASSNRPKSRSKGWVPKGQRYTRPRGEGWYCRARASNGAWGWGENTSRSIARSYAIGECGKRSRGRSCGIQYCRQGGPAGASNARSNRVRSRTSAGRRRLYDCSVCARKLLSDVQRGWASARLKSYVAQARAGYANCKRKAFGSCQIGDIRSRTLRRGCSSFSGRGYRACIGRIVGR